MWRGGRDQLLSAGMVCVRRIYFPSRSRLRSETRKVVKPPIVESGQVDYLFHRMFAMVRLLLKSTVCGS
jgi:hypothetical protein